MAVLVTLLTSSISKVEGMKDELVDVKTALKSDSDRNTTTNKVYKLVAPAPPTNLFTGREEELLRISENFDFSIFTTASEKQRRFVLFGLGGMGKTQLALKFLHDNRER